MLRSLVPSPQSGFFKRHSSRALASKGFGQKAQFASKSDKPDIKAILKRITEVQCSSKQKIETAKKFYEGAWSAPDGEELDQLIDSTIADDHSQEDMVWQPNPRRGRDSIRNGIKFIRKLYPDARFVVDRAALTEDGSQVFVQWTMTGTFEGEVDATTGMSLLTIEEGLIIRTQVYRQALRAEVEMGRKRQDGQVPQGNILINRGE